MAMMSTSPEHALRHLMKKAMLTYRPARQWKIVEKALRDAGVSAADVVRTVVYLRDIKDADVVAKAHLETFGSVRPASTLVQVTSMLRPWQKVEIEAYAKLESVRS